MIEQYIEALIFASDTSIPIEELMSCLQAVLGEDISEDVVKSCVQRIEERYQLNESAIELVKIAGGYQFLTKKNVSIAVQQLNLQRSKKKLSQASLETLSIIAYRQPITKLEIEQIRGVNCDYTVQKLLDKDLISISGKAESPGRPILYCLSQFFLDYFGINSVIDLPQLKDIEEKENIEIGEKSE